MQRGTSRVSAAPFSAQGNGTQLEAPPGKDMPDGVFRLVGLMKVLGLPSGFCWLMFLVVVWVKTKGSACSSKSCLSTDLYDDQFSVVLSMQEPDHGFAQPDAEVGFSSISLFPFYLPGASHLQLWLQVDAVAPGRCWAPVDCIAFPRYAGMSQKLWSISRYARHLYLSSRIQLLEQI